MKSFQDKGPAPSTDEWIKKMWYINTMAYYSAMRKKEILPFVKTCINLEDIMLSEISQTEKSKYCMIPLTHGILKKQKEKQAHRYRDHLWLPEVGIGGWEKIK